MRNFILILLFITYTTVIPQSKLEIAPQQLFQGDTIFVYLTIPNNIKSVNCRFNNKEYKFYKIKNNLYRCIIGLPADIIPKKYVIDVKYIDKFNRIYFMKKDVEIQERKFGIQKLTLLPKKLKLYSHKDVEYEYQRIFRALSIETEEQLWKIDKFIMPLKGRITTKYGVRRIINNRKSKSYHKGIDIAPNKNERFIRAFADGIVTLTANFVMHGKTIVINHGQGVATLYLHLSEIFINEGDKVKCGDKIGIAGESGVATAPHLHFGLYIHKVAVDPLNWLKTD